MPLHRRVGRYAFVIAAFVTGAALQAGSPASARRGDWSIATGFPRWVRRPQTWLIILLVCLTCYRLSLTDSGHFFIGDEYRYISSFRLIDHLLAGERFLAVHDLFTALAKPGLALLGTIPALLQRLAGAPADIARMSLHDYDVTSAFNVVVTLGVTLCVFGVTRTWLNSSWYALLVTTVYSLLCNANVYIRHMLPYNQSLLIALAALWVVRAPIASLRSCIGRGLAVGLLCGLSFACYPGQYPLLGVVGLLVLAMSRHRLRATLAFIAAVGVVLLGFELLAQAVGVSYFEQIARQQAISARWASAPWHRGAVEEIFLFAWRYLLGAEGTVGVVLWILFVVYVVFLLPRRATRTVPAARIALVGLLGAYLYHASMGFFFERLVFFPRNLSPYLPFVVYGAVVTLQHIPWKRLRRAAVAGLLLVSLGSFVDFSWHYSRLIYPGDLLTQTMAQKGIELPLEPAIDPLRRGLAFVWDSVPGGSFDVMSHEAARGSEARFLAANFGSWVYPYRSGGEYELFEPPDDFELLISAVHPIGFMAYAFENGYPPQDRALVRTRCPTMRLYERVSGSAGPGSLGPCGGSGALPVTHGE